MGAVAIFLLFSAWGGMSSIFKIGKYFGLELSSRYSLSYESFASLRLSFLKIFFLDFLFRFYSQIKKFYFRFVLLFVLGTTQKNSKEMIFNAFIKILMDSIKDRKNEISKRNKYFHLMNIVILVIFTLNYLCLEYFFQLWQLVYWSLWKDCQHFSILFVFIGKQYTMQWQLKGFMWEKE